MRRRNFLAWLLAVPAILLTKDGSDDAGLRPIEYKQGDGELIEIPVKFKPGELDNNKDYFLLT